MVAVSTAVGNSLHEARQFMKDRADPASDLGDRGPDSIGDYRHVAPIVKSPTWVTDHSALRPLH
jgi:hypothetical protein